MLVILYAHQTRQYNRKKRSCSRFVSIVLGPCIGRVGTRNPWFGVLTGVLRGRPSRPSRLQARFDLLTGRGRARSGHAFLTLPYRVLCRIAVSSTWLSGMNAMPCHTPCRSVPKQPSPDPVDPQVEITLHNTTCVCVRRPDCSIDSGMRGAGQTLSLAL